MSFSKPFNSPGSPISKLYLATAISVVVKVSPPNTFAFSVNKYPTLSGPFLLPFYLTILPPPKPIETMSGNLKLVLTPPTSVATADCLGKPCLM